MGMYDEIKFKCPNCGKEIYAQSKTGNCLLEVYPHYALPEDVAFDANRHAPFICECGKSWMFSDIPVQKQYVCLNIIELKKENE